MRAVIQQVERESNLSLAGEVISAAAPPQQPDRRVGGRVTDFENLSPRSINRRQSLLGGGDERCGRNESTIRRDNERFTRRTGRNEREELDGADKRKIQWGEIEQKI